MRFARNRLLLTLTAAQYKDQRLPVLLTCYDTDLLPGLYYEGISAWERPQEQALDKALGHTDAGLLKELQRLRTKINYTTNNATTIVKSIDEICIYKQDVEQLRAEIREERRRQAEELAATYRRLEAYKQDKLRQRIAAQKRWIKAQQRKIEQAQKEARERGCWSNVWKGTKWLGGKLWEGTKWVGEKLWEGTKWVGEKLWEGTKWVGEKLWKGTKWCGTKLWKATKWVGTKLKQGLDLALLSAQAGLKQFWKQLKKVGAWMKEHPVATVLIIGAVVLTGVGIAAALSTGAAAGGGAAAGAAAGGGATGGGGLWGSITGWLQSTWVGKGITWLASSAAGETMLWNTAVGVGVYSSFNMLNYLLSSQSQATTEQVVSQVAGSSSSSSAGGQSASQPSQASEAASTQQQTSHAASGDIEEEEKEEAPNANALLQQGSAPSTQAPVQAQEAAASNPEEAVTDASQATSSWGSTLSNAWNSAKHYASSWGSTLSNLFSEAGTSGGQASTGSAALSAQELREYEDLAQALSDPQNSPELAANCQKQVKELLSQGKTAHSQQDALALRDGTADLLKQLKGQYKSLRRAYDTSVDASDYMNQQLGQQIRALKQLEQDMAQTEQSLKTLCERFELEVPDLTAAPPISQETLISAFNQVLDYTTPGSELIKIALGTADAPQRWEEYVALAANTALDFLPGGKALKLFKGASAKLGLAKLKKLLTKQAKKKAGKLAGGVVKLTKKGQKKLGKLIGLKDKSAREALKLRGGNASATHVGRGDYWEKTLGEIANLAGAEDQEAKTILKLIKKAGKYAQKYGGK